jgi:hypothetical protein
MISVARKVQITLRVVAGLLVVAVLLAPSYVMALVWTPLDFLVAVLAILLVVAFSRSSKLRWVLAVVAALLIAIPPYPYWVFYGGKRGWYLHFFGGFTLQTLPIGTFCSFFVVALALFAVLFWALPHPRRYADA